MDNEGILAADTAVGQHRIVRILGRGGFGVTYEAWDTHLKRAVAIKEYFPHGLADRGADGVTVNCPARNAADFSKGLDRFLEEARAVAQFHDPRIVRVHGFLQANQTAYMVMDMERGTLLRDQVLQQGGLRPDDARQVLCDILQALQVIHGQNYLHRDIKPSNLMRRGDGQIVLLDFGSARMAQRDAGKGHTVVITPGYAPIEQYDTETSQGPGTDLYATGASLLFCLTGKAPPDGFKRAIAMQSNEPDPIEPLLRPVAVAGGVAGKLCEIIRWLMRPQAAQRPRDAGAVLGRLQVEAWTSEPTLLVPMVNLSELRSIPSKLVEPMRQHLERHIGGEATPILLGSIRAARNAQDLIDRVTAQVADTGSRQVVAEGLRSILSMGQADAAASRRPSTTSVASVSRPTTTATAPLADETTSRLLAGELAKFIGPIANMLVKRNAARAASRQDLIQALAAEITEPADRAAFLKAVERIPALAGSPS